MSIPLVSIIIPTFNRAHLIGETLDSVIAQIYTNWECIVVDDGSSDHTDEVLNKYCKQDSRIKYFHRPDDYLSGGNGARNYGFELSEGDYINWFDSDDLMFKNYLESHLTFLNNSEYNYSICKSKWITIDKKELDGFWSREVYSKDPINDYIKFSIFWHIDAVVYKKQFLKENSLEFDESLKQSQEYDFHVKVLEKDLKYGFIDRFLVKAIANKESISYSSKNNYLKTISSLKVRNRFLDLSKNFEIKYDTKLHLLNDLFRIFQQETIKRNFRTSCYSAWFYIKAHFKDTEILKKYLFRHLFPLIAVLITYNFTGKGYMLFKMTNTFNLSKKKR